MPDPLITIPIPTIKGREALFAHTLESYRATANVQLIEFHDLPNCGLAWAQGADMAEGQYIHFAADDVTMHPNWWQKPVAYCDKGFLPAPRVLNTDGTLQSCGDNFQEMKEGAVPAFTRAPFISVTQWKQLSELVRPFLLKAHYWTDNIFSAAGRTLGMETVVCRSYEYTHHMADIGASLDTRNVRMQQDHALYQEYIGNGFAWNGTA